jgi:hypothetical protein
VRPGGAGRLLAERPARLFVGQGPGKLPVRQLALQTAIQDRIMILRR